MEWMARDAQRRQEPALALARGEQRHHAGHESFTGRRTSLGASGARDRAAISLCYGAHRDYHDGHQGPAENHRAEIRGSAARPEVKVFRGDTAPVMEKPLAQGGRIGWQGKHHQSGEPRNSAPGCFWARSSQLRSSSRIACGSRSLRLVPGLPRHLSPMPFPAPYQLDARPAAFPTSPSSTRGRSPTEFRHAIGRRIYGCEDLPGGLPLEQVPPRGERGEAESPRKISSTIRLPALLGTRRSRVLWSNFPDRRSNGSGATGSSATS